MANSQSSRPDSPRDIVVTLRFSRSVLVLLLMVLAAVAVLAILRFSAPPSRAAEPAVAQTTAKSAPAELKPGIPADKTQSPAKDEWEQGAVIDEDAPGPQENQQDNYGAEPVPPPEIEPPRTADSYAPHLQPAVLPQAQIPDPPPSVDETAGINEPEGARDNPEPPSAPDTPSRRRHPGEQAVLNGAGSTFINPIFQKWATEYHSREPEIQINYLSIGSGAGIHQLEAGTTDFAVTDAPLTDAQLRETQGRFLHIPAVLNGIVFIYNVPEISGELNLTPEILSGIYLGKVHLWNDPLIIAANPSVRLPDLEIVVVHRSDASGASLLLTDYLAKVSSEWRNTVGNGMSVAWPTGISSKGNEGVKGTVTQEPGAIGYVELQYAASGHHSSARLKNAAGQFVSASLASLTEAAAPVTNSGDYRASLTNSPRPGAYPIVGFTWILYAAESTRRHRQDMMDFLDWLLTRGEEMAPQMGYAPLPGPLAKHIRQQLAALRPSDAQ